MTYLFAFPWSGRGTDCPKEVIREELKQFLGAAWGESTPDRKGYRNGSYTRDLATASGPIEDLEVPRDREGHFQTQVFDRYSPAMNRRWLKGR